jgi:formamidopyrimidine-DNA glycosylase
MPELPEVEAFKEYIQKHCLHKKIQEIEVTDSASIKGASPLTLKRKLIHHSFSNVQRFGKYVVIQLSAMQELLVMHFGMSGFVYYTKDVDQIVKFSRVNFIFKDNSILHWIDLRKFGKVWLISNVEQIKGLAALGPDALKISQKQFIALLERNNKKNIKAFLMDQSTIAGIGNEYSDEILFQAGVDPHHRIEELSDKTLQNIYAKMRKILLFTIKLQVKAITNSEGKPFFTKTNRELFPDSYLQSHRRRRTCPKNEKHPLKKVTIAGRSTYYCPKDQQ